MQVIFVFFLIFFQKNVYYRQKHREFLSFAVSKYIGCIALNA